MELPFWDHFFVVIDRLTNWLTDRQSEYCNYFDIQTFYLIHILHMWKVKENQATKTKIQSQKNKVEKQKKIAGKAHF